MKRKNAEITQEEIKEKKPNFLQRLINKIKDKKLTVKKSKEKKPIQKKTKQKIEWRVLLHKTLSLLLCLVIIGVAGIGLITPVFSSGDIKVTPTAFMESLSWNDMNVGSLPNLFLSYYVYKIFYFVYSGALALALFFLMLVIIVRSENLHKQASAIMFSVLVLMLVSMLAGFNCINIYKALAPNYTVTSLQYVFFIIGFILMIAKFIVDIIFGKKTIDAELKATGMGILTSFTQSFLTILAIVFPLYIFPGTAYRMSGIDIILGKDDILDFLPTVSAYKTLLIGFTAVTAFCLIANIIFFLLNRKLFVHFNKFSHMFSLFALIIYALMGVNYMLCYVDAAGYNVVFNTSMNTYSYFPLALLFLFWLGCGFTKLSLSGVNVQYKVYASPDELNEDSERKNKEKEKEKQEREEKEKKEKEEREKEEKERREKEEREKEEKEKREKEEKEKVDPIPAFSELDRKSEQFKNEYMRRTEHTFTGLTLPSLVKHIIEYAKYSKERLSYGPIEVKTFIAGLAASRLSILQGMSGTGKTSLPKVFMEAIDGFCEIVAIESSWRDKNELLGYYNEFNKKYTPKSFTQFLYKASLNSNVPYFIVLDEMNLSRIEYYFSDFLSLMEARENMRHIKLFDIQLYPHIDERTRYLALRDGHTIDIPTNVWFIGTANRDESTFEISDKVYDRAQTMNFDKRAPKVKAGEQVDYPKKFVPYTELRKLMDETKTVAFDAENYDTIKKIEKLLAPYKISFGNRVLKQIEEFVNAYVACSEISSAADRDKFTLEAVDCIILSKVVRKLELKQVNDFDSLIDGFASLNLPKCKEFLNSLTDMV